MKTLLQILALLLALLPGLGTTLARADDSPKYLARAHLEPAGQVMPGQPVKLVVDAMTTAWFTAAPVFPPIDIPGAIVSPPGDDATNLNEDINGARWFGVSRTYIVTPQAGGDLSIPAITLLLHVGQINSAIKANTPVLKLSVKVVQRPPGAENALATSRLQVTQTLDRPVSGLRQGDAFTRSITISADGVQGMLLPPTTFAPVDGLAVYPKAGKVQDISKQRQGFLGSTRTDAATYVAQRAGDYTLPGIRIAWWDTGANQLRTAQIPPLTFSVAANAAYKPAIALPGEASAPQAAKVTHINVRQIAEISAAALLALLLLWLLLPRLLRWSKAGIAALQRRRQRELASEQRAYSALRHATHGDAQRLPAALYHWLDRIAQEPGVQLAQPAQAGVAMRTDDVQHTLQTIYGVPAAPLQRGALRKALQALRTRLLQAHARPYAQNRLPALNPGRTGDGSH